MTLPRSTPAPVSAASATAAPRPLGPALLPPRAVRPALPGPLRLGPADLDACRAAAWWSPWSAWVDDLRDRLRTLTAGHPTVVRADVLDADSTVGAVAAQGWSHYEHQQLDAAIRLGDALVSRVTELLAHYADDLAADDGPITAVTDLAGETHNGGHRTLRVDTAAGRSWAYKHRPVHGEDLFLAPGGLFPLLASLGPRLHLPTLPVVPPAGASHSWQEWVDGPPPEYLSTQAPVTAAAVPSATARDTWRAVGCLSGAAAVFGIQDLGEENVVTRVLDGRVELVPIDLEVFLEPERGLVPTMLVSRPDDPRHHCGIENLPRPCTSAGPTLIVDGARSVPLDRPSARATSRSLLIDPLGHAGYAGHLASYLRGLADTWVTACRHRHRLADGLRTRPQARRARHLPRPTADYAESLTAWQVGRTETAHHLLSDATPAEVEQLARGDVPYLVREVGDADLEAWEARLTLAGLGPALRDAVEHVRDTLVVPLVDGDDQVAVAVWEPGSGCAAVPVTGTHHRVTFRWDPTTIRLVLDDRQPGRRPDGDPAHADLRDRLLRLDAADAALRQAWTASGFTDSETEARLTRLLGAAAPWFGTVLDEHGWPDEGLVGEQAQGAAARLVQHLVDHPALRDRGARELALAAVRGAAPWRCVAELDDARAVRDGQAQRFGTKFERVDGRLRPCLLDDDEAAVARRRAAYGLEPLENYAARVAVWVEEVESGGR